MKIKQNIEYGLQGQFKVDVYDRQGDLVETTDYFDNFITQTGLNYPLDYNFADCFRYLTLGRNGGPNAMDVTGLLAGGQGAGVPVDALVKNYNNDLISYQKWEYLGDAHLDKKSNSSAGSCGTIVGADGPSYYRGWKLPTGDNVFTEGKASIQEFMVSPSTGLDPTGAYAFSRVPRNVVIPSGTRTIVTYMLNVKIKHTGINYFHSGTFNTGEAEVSEQYDLVESFGNLSGYYRQCYHGLRCVDNQGRTFIPKYGDPMEPSQVRLDSLAIYFSPDNSQFDVNRHGGGQSNVKSSYATDGLIALSFNHNLAANANVSEEDIHNNAKQDLSDLPSDTSSPFEHHKNIRLNASSSERPPRLSNYTIPTDQTVDLEESIYNYLDAGTDGDSAISMATFGSAGHRPGQFDRGFKTAFSSMMSNLGVDIAKFTGRRRNLVRKAFITPINALGHNTRFGSLVYAFKNGSAYWPAVDCMFFDNSGRSVQQHYRVFSGCYLTERGRGIIKSTLTTDPPTLGGFNVGTIHGPIVYDTNFGTSDITGHSGFYADQQVWNENTYQYDTVKGVGTRISGEIAATYTAPGSTGTYAWDSIHAGLVDVGGLKYYGWGAIQGHLSPTAFDYGVVDHRIEIKSKVPSTHPNYDNQHPDKLQTVVTPIQTPPETYGVDGKGYEFSVDDLYWPNVMGPKLNLQVDDLNYYDVGVGVLPDPAGYFTATNQIVADITFNTDLLTFVPDPANLSTYLPLKSVTDHHSNANQVCGFFLSRNTGWLEVDHHGNTAGSWSTTLKYAKGNIVDDGTGICSVTAYSTKATCIAQGTCSDGSCSDSSHTTEAACFETDGTCSIGGHATKTLCLAAGGDWSATNTWTEYTTQSTCVAQGTCSAGGHTDQSACEGAGEDWTAFEWTVNTWSEPTSVAEGATLYRSLVDDNEKSVPALHVDKWEQVYIVPYDGRELNMGWDNAGTFESTEAATKMRNQMKNLADQSITGYLVPSTHIANGDITNTTWVGNVANFPPANSVRVPVQSGDPGCDIYVGPSQAAYQIDAGQPEQLFDGWQAIGADGLGACMDASNSAATTADNDDICFPTKATNMVSRLSGQNVGPNDGPSYAVVFTGCDAHAGAGKPSDPIYLIAGRAVNAGGDFDWSVTAAYTGTVRVSDFLSPEGYFIHYESPRLLPNFATGQVATNAYPISQIKQGGVYPGMSNLNTLEVYMDISWSAPCADVVGCVEQEA